MTVEGLARRSPLRLRPDPGRVVAGLFVAGQEAVGGKDSRAAGVVERILELDEAVVVARLDEVRRRFRGRHHDLEARFSHHADRVADQLDPEATLSEERWLLLGAAFTHEHSVEAAALCNPSVVLHPDQSGLPSGGIRFVMSTRGIGEGHRSSIGFRVGTLVDGEVAVEPTGPHVVAGSVRASGLDGELGSRTYRAGFPIDSGLAERVLLPATPTERNGLEDARFVRFVDEVGAATYLATYTAYDGVDIRQQLLQTDDFLDFAMSPMVGDAASNKGLALFPRRVGGRFAALSRHDRESNAVAFADAIGSWTEAVTFQIPARDWDLVQIGNCGSPIETDEGWLVLTHGVGPMRTYAMGALLLDLEDPTRVVASLPTPLLEPEADEQDGYVPNVVYSCGSLLHDDTLLVPFGIADSSIGFATVSWRALLAAMR